MVAVYFEAFGKLPTAFLFCPDTEAMIKERTQTMIDRLGEKYWKGVVATSGSIIIGGALWYLGGPNVLPLFGSTRPRDLNYNFLKPELELELRQKRWGAINHFLDPNHDPKVDNTANNRPHLFLCQLMVLPQYQKGGAGKAMVEWGLKMADKQCLETYLFSEAGAVAFYKKLGFKVIGKIKVARHVWPTMMRVPQAHSVNAA